MSQLQNKQDIFSPSVSVLMTVYNAGEFLKQAIDSLLEQTLTDFEIIIIENGSTDGSRKIIHTYNDPRLKIFEHNKNIGRTPALIEAFKKSSGDLIAVQDADDVSLPLRLELQTNYLNENPDTVLVGTHCQLIDESNNCLNKFRPPCEPEKAHQKLAFENVIQHSSAMYRKINANTIGGYPENLAYAQDYGLWIQLATIGKIANLPQELVLIREHSGRLSNSLSGLLTRSFDTIDCLDKARVQLQLNSDSIRQNRGSKALETARLARSYFKTGNLVRCLFWAFRAILIDPSLIKKCF